MTGGAAQYASIFADESYYPVIDGCEVELEELSGGTSYKKESEITATVLCRVLFLFPNS